MNPEWLRVLAFVAPLLIQSAIFVWKLAQMAKTQIEIVRRVERLENRAVERDYLDARLREFDVRLDAMDKMIGRLER